ncbi:uncharacterized protein LOC121697358 [Alosa sapidissima]|uniref:uncharacterized protein LOC121697358 n=1 Tax=Alosa sapidissima TaxID=34773 RepID=UPI001C08FC25|nr:uncharacterized protein LOC121697358 [Alosa sapidissima]XP_041934788.1 uncharacterized protein LOC121697358 [Alosa sapidissima]
MGATVSVKNHTPYTWSFSASSQGHQTLHSGGSTRYDEKKLIHRYIYFSYGNHSNCISYEFNTHKGNPTITLRESHDRSRIELHCDTENSYGSIWCPNYGKMEDDERQRQQERHRQELQRQQEERRRQEEQRRLEQEELRRQERLERERRIQTQIDRENEVCRQKLSTAKEKLSQKQAFKGQERHHQHTHVLHQLVEDDAAAIERNEPSDIEEKFRDLLSKYSIEENETLQHGGDIEDRMKTLQNELTIQYCKESKLSIWFQFTLDQAVDYEGLSLTDKFSLLEAVVHLTLEGNLQSVVEDITEAGYDAQNNFILNLLQLLYVTNPTLARHLLLNLMESITKLSPPCKDILSQMVFNNMWTPVEIMLFIQSVSDKDQNKIPSILHTVQTYRLDCLSALAALDKDDPVRYLEICGMDEPKDAETILNEMRESNYPESILLVLEDVLNYMERELPKYALVDLSEEQIQEGKQRIKSLDFENPDMNILKQALLEMALAVQDCTTTTGPNGEKIEGYFPRLTQLASLLMLLLTKYGTKGEDEQNGRLLEIGTGEGKSCILAMFATIQAIREVKVDIVTSSPVLAIRDQEEWEKLYSKFGVTTSVVPPRGPVEKHEKLVEDAYSKQIVFGTVGTFAADILKQEFERKTTRGTRDFDMVIVDEVDYMTLDNGVQVTFLSHEASGMRHVEQVLANIWAMTSACRPIEMLETGEIQWTTKIQHFHKAAFSAVAGSGYFSSYDILLPGANLGFFSQDDIDQLKQAEEKANDEKQNEIQNSEWKAIEIFMKKIGTEQQHDLLLILESATEIPIECYSLSNNKAKLFGDQKTDEVNVKMLLLENGCACQIMSEKDVIDATVLQIKKTIRYSSGCDANSLKKNSKIEENEFMIIPLFLEKYIDNMLPVFVENALKAVGMSQGREYMIDKGSAAEQHGVSDTDPQYHVIIPVDFKASGVLEKNKRWGDGLQQFLEMKHQLAISQMSNVTNYMSNFHYFKRYMNGKGIFGVSGTLGGQADQDFLAKHYKARSYAIPAHRHSKIVELPVIQVSRGNNPWIQRICETARKVAERGQVVLVICEDVKTANELETNMKTQSIDSRKITMYTMSGSHNIEKRKFDGGNIIIATNLGGRGTDIKVDHEVNRCGGLFVLLTHFPSNRRVEKQVFGRTARKGNPGMVQMMLCHDHLAPAYQGQSTEVMRHLREEYEVRRIADMEKDELLEIEMKEKLFSTFCKFLSDFDRNYTEQEKKEPSKQLHKKFDYQPALNALKESWAMWLTLHEEHINRHDDIMTLTNSLILQLEKTRDMLLEGKSNNFYDHIKQAIIRTDLHCKNRNKSDHGALSCWENIVSCHEMYSAVALYNQAFITINLRKQDYKSKAKHLLKRAQHLVDVYLSESSNTMVSCNLSVTSDFEPHHKGDTNLQMQMEVRMNIFKSWKGFIERAINKLEELEKVKNDAVTDESSVYNLSNQKDYITTNELEALYDYGLGIVFEVKKKPRFCIDALICALLGVLQVVAGVLVCALSFGSASQFGLGLISDGVSDMISGIKGMIDGSFSWAEWAISKAISIGMSLLSAGFSVIKKVCSAAKSIFDGTKTFANVADDVIKSGSRIFKSVQGTAQKAVSGTFRETMKKMSSTTLTQNLKHASKYAIQEIGKQALTAGLNYAVDKGVQTIFRLCLEGAFKQIVSSAIKSNSTLDQVLTKVVCSGVPKATLQKETPDFRIDTKIEEEIKGLVKSASNTEELVSGYTTVHEVIDKLSTVSEKAAGIMNQKGIMKGIIEGIQMATEIAEYTTTFVEILQAVPTSAIIDRKFVPTFSESMKDIESYDNDGRHNLPDAIRLKKELLGIIAQRVSEEFIDAFTQHVTSISTKEFKKHLNSTTGKAVSNVLGRYKTQSFFDDQSHKHNMKAAASRKTKPLSEPERMELQDIVENISNEQRPATALDLYVLTKSDLLKGKGIRFTVVDKKGKKLSEEHYPGTDSKGGEIKLRLTKTPLNTKKKSVFLRFKERIQGKSHPYKGHFDIVESDGSITPVMSKNQNCLYHAIIQATENTQGDDLNEKAVKLRSDVQKDVQGNLEKYRNVVKLQKGYEASYTNSGKYAIKGGQRGKRKILDKQATNELTQMNSEFEIMKKKALAKTYRLGSVGKYNWLKNQRNMHKTNNDGADNNKPIYTSVVNADHIPPIDTIKKAFEEVKKDPEKEKELSRKNPKLYKMIEDVVEHPYGNSLLVMEVLTVHHIQALTTGNSHKSHRCRELISKTLVSGDVEKMMKQSLILAHPVTSQSLRDDAGLSRPPQRANDNILCEDDTKLYYKMGNKNIVKRYCQDGIIDQNQRDRLLSWVQEDSHLDRNTPEYKECLDALKEFNI